MPLSALIWTRVKRAKSSFLTTFSVVSFIYLYIIYHSDTIDIHFIIDISYPLFCLSPYSTSVLVRVSSFFSISIHYASAFLVFLTIPAIYFNLEFQLLFKFLKSKEEFAGFEPWPPRCRASVLSLDHALH